MGTVVQVQVDAVNFNQRRADFVLAGDEKATPTKGKSAKEKKPRKGAAAARRGRARI